ncbi:hypothetical protein F7725_022528, partial [Dissostichus mawsoni]
MDIQKETYSAYRGMHSFKLLLEVAPNAVITYCSKLYPGSTSDKEIVRDSGVLQHFKPGDLILADKGFLIQNILPEGVTVNIPPFLCHGQLTHSEAQATKLIAQNRIHVERANARLKEFRILKFIPSHLRHFLDKLVQEEGQWKSPHEFNPENFLNDRGEFVKPEAFVPFSTGLIEEMSLGYGEYAFLPAGHRMCLGEVLARMELFLIVVTLLRRFKFIWPEDAGEPDYTPVFGSTQTPKPYSMK